LQLRGDFDNLNTFTTYPNETTISTNYDALFLNDQLIKLVGIARAHQHVADGDGKLIKFHNVPAAYIHSIAIKSFRN